MSTDKLTQENKKTRTEERERAEPKYNKPKSLKKKRLTPSNVTLFDLLSILSQLEMSISTVLYLWGP